MDESTQDARGPEKGQMGIQNVQNEDKDKNWATNLSFSLTALENLRSKLAWKKTGPDNNDQLEKVIVSFVCFIQKGNQLMD